MGGISEQIGERVKLFRKEAGLTQEQLAVKAGMDLSYLGRIETGKENPSLKYLHKLSRALGVKLSKLVDL